MRSALEGVYTFEQADRGRILYSRHCVACHVADLTGRLADATAQAVPPLGGVDFQRKWRGRTLIALWEQQYLCQRRDAGVALKGKESAELVAFILNVNGYPAGVSELPDTKWPLASIRLGP
jgi:cytochrome c